MGKTKIEWADRTWNPIIGCTKISAGCANCYAERMAKRFVNEWGLDKENPFAVNKRRDVEFVKPLRWTKPARIFICSMGDLFHEDVPDQWIDAVFAAMGMTYDAAATDKNNVITACKQRHTYMILTKRPERMRDYIAKLAAMEYEDLRVRFYHFAKRMCMIKDKCEQLWHSNASMIVTQWIKEGMQGLWLGVTAENQETANERIPVLLDISAEKHFVSVEPMLGPVDLTFTAQIEHPDNEGYGVDAIKGLDWVICGGESGPYARPMHPDWVRGLRDECNFFSIPFLFKQWGEWRDGERIGKKKAGRELDSELWDQYPDGVLTHRAEVFCDET